MSGGLPALTRPENLRLEGLVALVVTLAPVHCVNGSYESFCGTSSGATMPV